MLRRARVESKTAATILLIATLLGFFFAAQMYFSAASLAHPVSWPQALYWSFGDWYEWALLSPVIIWLCRALQKRRRPWFGLILSYLIVGILLGFVHAVLCAEAAVVQGWATAHPAHFSPALRGLLANRFHYNLAVYAVIVCAWHAFDYARQLRERERHALELSARLAQAQLQTLRMQINPHFLFNSLNAVSSLMLKDVMAANKMISRLAEVLRMALDSSDQQEVPLEQEITFLRKYLEIEQIRFGDRLQLSIEIDPSTCQAIVPTLILQPLVENAIQHAIEPQTSAGQIQLSSSLQNGRLLLLVTDNGPGLKTIENSPTSGPGRIGLNNTQERLRKLYGEEQEFALRQNQEGGVTASISIPFHLHALPDLS